MPKVTVAIPTYNRKEYLKECIDSVLNQTFQDFNIIVFDNCSDYDVQDFLSTFNDERISLVPSPVNTGNYDRVFLHHFDSESVIIFHDDDIMHPELLEREFNLLDAHPELIWVGSKMRFGTSSEGMRTRVSINGNSFSIHDTSGIVRLILSGFDLCYGSVMYRSKYLSEVPTYKLYFKWGDRPHLVELSKKGRVGVLDQELVNYRVHPGQDSQSVASDKNIFLMNLFIFYRECLGGLVDRSDRKLFYQHTADNLPLAGFSFASTLREYADVMKEYRRNDLLRLRYMTPRGLYRFARGLVGFMRRK